MTFSSLISGTVPHHGKYNSRNGQKVTQVIPHHWAGTSGGVESLTNPRRQASVHYIILSNGRILGQVPEEYRAWTTGTQDVDARSITFEIQNSSGRAPGKDDSHPESWKISAAAWRSMVRLIADIAVRHRWGSVQRHRVRAHREYRPTACPGGYLWARQAQIAAQANQLLRPAVKKQTTKKGIQMKHYYRLDKTANGKGKRVLKPGEGLYLNQTNARNSQATNIAHGVGLYSFTGHVYAKGTPGDVLEVNLLWQYVKSKPVKNSPHYVQRFVFDKDGLIRENVEFKRAVTAGHAVYLRVMAPKTNKGKAEITLLASDAYLFV